MDSEDKIMLASTVHTIYPRKIERCAWVAVGSFWLVWGQWKGAAEDNSVLCLEDWRRLRRYLHCAYLIGSVINIYIKKIMKISC